MAFGLGGAAHSAAAAGFGRTGAPPSETKGNRAAPSGSTSLTDALDSRVSNVTKKLSFIQDKVIRVSFAIFLICAVSMGAAALIVEFPVISTAFFSVLTVAGGASLLVMAVQGLSIWHQKRKAAKAEQFQQL